MTLWGVITHPWHSFFHGRYDRDKQLHPISVWICNYLYVFPNFLVQYVSDEIRRQWSSPLIQAMVEAYQAGAIAELNLIGPKGINLSKIWTKIQIKKPNKIHVLIYTQTKHS